MGGCNSTLRSIIGGVAFVGAIAQGDVAGSVNAYNAVNSDKKSGCSKDKVAVVNATNEIIAASIVQSLTTCTQISESWQNIEISCTPVVPVGQLVFEENKACGMCVTGVFQGMLDQHELERATWKRGTSAEVRVRLDIDAEYGLMLSRLGNCGLAACKACTFANITQSNILTADSRCYDTLRNSDTFKSNLTSQVKQQLVNNQDVLAGVAKAFANSNVTSVTETIVNRISSVVNQSFLDDLASRMQSKFSGSSITQANAFQVAVNYVDEKQVATQAFSSAVFTTIEDVANQQNTLNDVGTLVFEATVGFTAAINNVVGQVMIATLALLGVIVLFIIGYGGYKFIKKSTFAAERLEKEIEFKRYGQQVF
jgi:hypothetical protein